MGALEGGGGIKLISVVCYPMVNINWKKKNSKMEAFICNSYILDLNDHFKDYNNILFSRFILSIINQAELIKVFFF